MHGKIKYLHQKDIDRKKWDHCIETATDGLIYAYSFYLDAMADDWSALVLDDYVAVMPLPLRKKYGITYVYQPAFMAQLGVFGASGNLEIYAAFLKAIPSRIRYMDLPLHHKMKIEAGKYSLTSRVNFVLNLNRPYDELYTVYRENIRRNIKKCKSYGCSIVKQVSIDDIITIATEQELGNTSQKDFKHFKKLFHLLHSENKALSYGVVSAKGELLASCVFYFSHHRAYYILVGNHPNGRTLGASHALIDAFISDYSGRELLLDFEGSDIHNLAFFYSSFGAVEEKYLMLKWNRLPFGFRWIKKNK